ncbi:MAG: hypothetical protein AAGC53_22460, partial [Actinomycetota bacterium]
APTTTTPPTTTTTTAAPTTTTTSTTTTTTTTTTTLPAGPSGFGFSVVTPGALPSSLGNGNLTSNDQVFVWKEADVILASDLTVLDPGAGGWVGGDGDTTTTIAAGTHLCVYHVHSDPVSGEPDMVAGIDFGGTVVGLTLTRDDLIDTDEFEVDGVDYRPDGLGAIDRLKVAGSYVELDLDSTVGTRDQIRIFTTC